MIVEFNITILKNRDLDSDENPDFQILNPDFAINGRFQIPESKEPDFSPSLVYVRTDTVVIRNLIKHNRFRDGIDFDKNVSVDFIILAMDI